MVFVYIPQIKVYNTQDFSSPRAPEDMGRASLHITDMPLFVGSAMLGDMLDQLGAMLMGGRIDTAFLGGAQIDKFWNLNTLSMGNYHHPTRRLGGTGGNTDAACLAKKVILLRSLDTLQFHLGGV